MNEVNKATVREQVVSQVESFVEKEKELLKDRKRSKEQIKAIENLEKDYAVDNKKTKLSEQGEGEENTKSTKKSPHKASKKYKKARRLD